MAPPCHARILDVEASASTARSRDNSQGGKDELSPKRYDRDLMTRFFATVDAL